MHISKKLIKLLVLLIVFSNCKKEEVQNYSQFILNYQGTPFIDSISAFEVQSIPGKVECEYYDFGGDSIAYFDTDKNNNGSGSLNKGNDYLSTFRMEEAPDISFTKFHDNIDNSIYNMVQPEKDQLYLGWTEPGEWTRYTIDVKESAKYKIGTMYTPNRGGSIQLIIDNTDTTSFLNIKSTFHPDDPVSWRQWHHWNYSDSLATIYINKGLRVITLKIVEKGNFNFDYLTFDKLK